MIHTLAMCATEEEAKEYRREYGGYIFIYDKPMDDGTTAVVFPFIEEYTPAKILTHPITYGHDGTLI